MKDIIVIGAGILGASTAYRLAKHGANVTIIDRKDSGQATEAAAGIICPWLSQRRNKAWYELVRAGAHFYPSLIEELHADGEFDTGYKKVGAIGLHTDEERLYATKERVTKRQKQAPEIGKVKLLNQDETHQMFPFLDEQFKSIHVSGAARVNGAKLRDALLRAAKKHGVKVIHGSAKLIQEKSQVTGVKVDQETMLADTVIAATGAWMTELLKPVGVDFNVIPQKAQIIHLKTQEDVSNYPVVMPPNNQYILPIGPHKVIIGATHESEAGFDTRVTLGGVHEIVSKAIEIAPGLANSTILKTKVGFRPIITTKALPVIGSLPDISGLILANGLGATGLTMGPYVGNLLAKLALGMKIDIDLLKYDVREAIRII